MPERTPTRTPPFNASAVVSIVETRQLAIPSPTPWEFVPRGVLSRNGDEPDLLVNQSQVAAGSDVDPGALCMNVNAYWDGSDFLAEAGTGITKYMPGPPQKHALRTPASATVVPTRTPKSNYPSVPSVDQPSRTTPASGPRTVAQGLPRETRPVIPGCATVTPPMS